MDCKFEKQRFLFKDAWKMIFGIPNTFVKVATIYGITIEMRTKETNHRGCPHCHAKYREQSIRISLKDFSILDSTNMDSKHQNLAVDYVKNNLEFLISLWNEIPGVIQI